MNNSWNIGMQGGYGGEIRTGGFSMGRRRWPAREKDLGHDIRPEQIRPQQPDRAAPDRERPTRQTPPPDVSP
jgi:hypothetical protein